MKKYNEKTKQNTQQQIKHVNIKLLQVTSPHVLNFRSFRRELMPTSTAKYRCFVPVFVATLSYGITGQKIMTILQNNRKNKPVHPNTHKKGCKQIRYKLV